MTGTVTLYLPFSGPVVGGCGLTAGHELKVAAILVDETSVNRPASAFHEMITLEPERVAVMVGLIVGGVPARFATTA